MEKVCLNCGSNDINGDCVCGTCGSDHVSKKLKGISLKISSEVKGWLDE